MSRSVRKSLRAECQEEEEKRKKSPAISRRRSPPGYITSYADDGWLEAGYPGRGRQVKLSRDDLQVDVITPRRFVTSHVALTSRPAGHAHRRPVPSRDGKEPSFIGFGSARVLWVPGFGSVRVLVIFFKWRVLVLFGFYDYHGSVRVRVLLGNVTLMWVIISKLTILTFSWSCKTAECNGNYIAQKNNNYLVP